MELGGRSTDTVCSWHLSSWAVWCPLPSRQQELIGLAHRLSLAIVSRAPESLFPFAES